MRRKAYKIHKTRLRRRCVGLGENMSEAVSPAIAAMEGRGFYNRNSAMQAAGNATALALWEKAAQSVELGEETLVIADYGSSQGVNSMEPVSTAIRVLRSRVGEDRMVEVIHTDLPSNDFTSLFTALNDNPDSYMAGRSGIFPSAIGRTYFEGLMPPGRVHLGWNSWTIQWMSRNPIDAPDHAFAMRSKLPEIQEAVVEQQARDWRNFLELRSRELRPGGWLLSLFPGGRPDRLGWEWLTGELWEVFCDMRRGGVFSDHELALINVPTAPRRLADVYAPFSKEKQFAGLQIEHAEIQPGPDIHWDDFKLSGDATKLAGGWTGMMRGFSGPTIMNCIDPARDRAALVDEIFSRFADRLAANPQPHEHFIAIVLLSKTRAAT